MLAASSVSQEVGSGQWVVAVVAVVITTVYCYCLLLLLLPTVIAIAYCYCLLLFLLPTDIPIAYCHCYCPKHFSMIANLATEPGECLNHVQKIFRLFGPSPSHCCQKNILDA